MVSHDVWMIWGFLPPWSPPFVKHIQGRVDRWGLYQKKGRLGDGFGGSSVLFRTLGHASFDFRWNEWRDDEYPEVFQLSFATDFDTVGFWCIAWWKVEMNWVVVGLGETTCQMGISTHAQMNFVSSFGAILTVGPLGQDSMEAFPCTWREPRAHFRTVWEVRALR